MKGRIVINSIEQKLNEVVVDFYIDYYDGNYLHTKLTIGSSNRAHTEIYNAISKYFNGKLEILR